MAHNNTLFFRNLAPRPVALPAPLRRALDDAFGSVDTLRREMAAAARAMFGPGFVWLVKTTGEGTTGRGRPALRVLATYLAGSPYPQAHWRRQSLDMNTLGGASDAAQSPVRDWFAKQQQAALDTGRRGGGAAAATPPSPLPPLAQAPARPVGDEDRRAPGGVDVVPLLCLNTWEHVWIRDYGWGEDGQGGKADYVERWWNVIDWERVAADVTLGGRQGYLT